MPGVPVEEKVRRLNTMSYIDFLSKVAKIHPDAVAYVLALGARLYENGTLTLGGPAAPGAINLNPATHEISAKVIAAPMALCSLTLLFSQSTTGVSA